MKYKSQRVGVFVDVQNLYYSAKALYESKVNFGEILKMAPKLDTVVLCSGDGDFQLLLEHAKAEGCRAEVMSFGKSTSAKLIEEADDFIDMDKNYRKFTLKPPPKPKKI